MAQVLLFPHALGVTDGLRDLRDRLISLGHGVELIDLYEGRVFGDLDAGVDHASAVGFDAVIDRGVAAVDANAEGLVVIGISLGVLPAQKLAQTHPGVVGAVLIDAAVPAGAFGDWPDGVSAEIHLVEGDPLVAEDLDAARGLAELDEIDLHIHSGESHLTIDSSAPGHDAATAQRILDHLEAFLISR